MKTSWSYWTAVSNASNYHEMPLKWTKLALRRWKMLRNNGIVRSFHRWKHNVIQFLPFPPWTSSLKRNQSCPSPSVQIWSDCFKHILPNHPGTSRWQSKWKAWTCCCSCAVLFTSRRPRKIWCWPLALEASKSPCRCLRRFYAIIVSHIVPHRWPRKWLPFPTKSNLFFKTSSFV